MAQNINEADLFIAIKIFCQGFLDSISFHKSIPIIVNNNKAAYILFQIIIANVILLIGSLFMYERGIKLGIQKINEKWISHEDNDLVMFTAFTVYHLFWILPIYILCYACSTTWYKDFSKAIISSPTKKPVTATVQDSIYGTLIWFFIWIQVQILYAWLPSMLHKITIQHPTGIISTLLSTLISSISTSVFIIGLCLNCILYGWYAFDQRWISEGCDADTRFSQLENNYLYFIGFGLPYVMLFRLSKFFVAYGVYLSMFPFCMMIGAVTEYRHTFPKLKTVKFFTLSRMWTMMTLKMFRFKAKENLQKQLASSAKNAKKGKAE